jgi:glc operon protein GlcG
MHRRGRCRRQSPGIRAGGWRGRPCPRSCDPAIAKAATSASLATPTGGIPFEFGAGLGFASHGAIVNLGGGLPIVFQGAVLGAIGVGSGSTEQDVAVAEAGRDAVLAALGAPSA